MVLRGRLELLKALGWEFNLMLTTVYLLSPKPCPPLGSMNVVVEPGNCSSLRAGQALTIVLGAGC